MGVEGCGDSNVGYVAEGSLGFGRERIWKDRRIEDEVRRKVS